MKDEAETSMDLGVELANKMLRQLGLEIEARSIGPTQPTWMFTMAMLHYYFECMEHFFQWQMNKANPEDIRNVHDDIQHMKKLIAEMHGQPHTKIKEFDAMMGASNRPT